MSLPEPAALQEMIRYAVIQADQERPRAQQKTDGVLGFSSIGFCRQAAVLTTRETPPSDPQNAWPAVEGTILGEAIEKALKRKFPDWLFGNLDSLKVTATLKSRASVSGTPDVVLPRDNLVLDLKSKDGLGDARRHPWSDNYRWQVWLQALALQQAGILDPDKPVYMGLGYIDRSGRERPWIHVPEYMVWDPAEEDAVTEWISDVIYAVQHGEDASQDIPAPVCERICEFFTVCRGSLPVTDSTGPIEHEFLLEGIRMYEEARLMEGSAKSLKYAARDRLLGTNGIGLGMQVRTTEIAPNQVPGQERAGYTKVDVRAVRRRS